MRLKGSSISCHENIRSSRTEWVLAFGAVCLIVIAALVVFRGCIS